MQQVIARIDAALDTLDAKLSQLEGRLANLEKTDAVSKAEFERVRDDIDKNLKELHKLLNERAKYVATGRDPLMGAIREQLERNKADIKKIARSGGSLSFDISKELFTKAVMTIGTHTTGDILPEQQVPGIFAVPERAVHVRDFLTILPTDREVIRYVRESGFVNNITYRAEGALASESEASFEAKEETVKEIATELNITIEMLEDIPFLEQFIRTRVVNKLLAKEDVELLYGNPATTPGAISGIKVNASAYQDVLADPNATRWDVLAAAVNQVLKQTNGGYAADVVLLSPDQFLKLILSKDASGSYILPQAFALPAAQVGTARVVPITAVAGNDFFVGAFKQGALLVLRDDVTVSISTENRDNFSKRIATLLFRERLTLIVPVGGAFVYGDIETALQQATA